MPHACGQFRRWSALLWSIYIFRNFSMASGKIPKIDKHKSWTSCWSKKYNLRMLKYDILVTVTMGIGMLILTS